MKHIKTNKTETPEFDWTKNDYSMNDASAYFNPLEKLKMKRKKSIAKIIFQFISICFWMIGLIVSVKYLAGLF